MPILNYTTSIDPLRSVAEIQRALSRHGARRTVVEYDPAGVPVGLSFAIETPDGERAFRLPAKIDGVLRALGRARGKGGVTRMMVCRPHAARVAWRILKDWVEAQLALVEAELVEVEEVLLPYMLDGAGRRTFYEAVKERHLSLPGSSQDRGGEPPKQMDTEVRDG
jgi:hypothetical protein